DSGCYRLEPILFLAQWHAAIGSPGYAVSDRGEPSYRTVQVGTRWNVAPVFCCLYLNRESSCLRCTQRSPDAGFVGILHVQWVGLVSFHNPCGKDRTRNIPYCGVTGAMGCVDWT